MRAGGEFGIAPLIAGGHITADTLAWNDRAFPQTPPLLVGETKEAAV